jgi:tetratricopeptide (TPR) repeat protein
LERYSEISPPEARLHFRLAQVYLKTSDWDLAADNFQKTIGTTAEQGPSFFGIGLARFSQKQYAAANEALTKALELDPKNPDYICLLAATLLAQNDPEQAIDLLDRLADQANKYPRVHYLYAQAYQMTGDQQKAKEHAQGFQLAQASRTPSGAAPDQLESVLSEAQSLLARNQIDQARRKFMDALEIDKTNWIAHSSLTRIYISSGFFNYALQHLTEMQKLSPEAFEFQYLMGSYWFERGDLVQSREYAEQAKLTQPDNADVHNLLGNIYLSLDDRKKAAEEYRIALELAPDRTVF